MGKIEIRSQALDPAHNPDLRDTSGFTLNSADDTAAPTAKGDWRESDVKRAIRAAQQAGLTAYRVEAAPDGTITIVVGQPAEDA